MTAVDYVVLAIYFTVIIAAGVYFSRGQVTTARQYFLGDGKMPVWAVACSVVACQYTDAQAQTMAPIIGESTGTSNGEPSSAAA